MLRKHVMVAIMLLVSLVILVMACAPQVGGPTPTTAPTTAAPKAAAPPTAAATPKPVAEKPQRGGTLVYAVAGEAAELDPHQATTQSTQFYAQLMFNTLLETDSAGQIRPGLAESWLYPDPKTLVLNLRKGVKFHDGTDFNAEAVKFNIGRLIGNPATDPYQSGLTYARTLLGNVKSVDVIDNYTVKFNLGTPQAALLGNLTITVAASMFSPAAVKKWDKDTRLHPVGTGPFELVEWVKDDHLTVKRFDGYWRKDEYGDQLPYLDRLIVKPIPDASVRLTNLRTGDVDVIVQLEPAQVPLVVADKNLKTAQWSSYVHRIMLNNASPPFDNKALRQAVAWAIDRKPIVKELYGGIGEGGKYYLSSINWAFDPTGKFYTRDLPKAKEKLAEGGKPNGFKFVLKTANSSLSLRVAQALKGQLAEVGIEMEVVPLEESRLNTDRNTWNYEGVFGSPGVATGVDPDQILYPYIHSKGSQWTKYNNPEVDKLLDKARTSYDQAERKVFYAQAQALVLDDSPYVYVQEGPVVSAMNQKVMGFIPNIDFYHLQEDWLWLRK